MKNPPIKEGFSFKSSFLLLRCPRPDSNRHGLFSQRILSPSCLPIPSPGQILMRRRPDSNRRMAVLQTDPLDHLGTTPFKINLSFN